MIRALLQVRRQRRQRRIRCRLAAHAHPHAPLGPIVGKRQHAQRHCRREAACRCQWQDADAEDRFSRTDLYVTILTKEMESLCRFPDIGVSYDYIKPSHRCLHVQRHLFTYTTTATTVQIARILHDSMDVRAHL